MSFDVSPDAYGRFMGRFSSPLAVELLDLLGPRRGDRALDVGCGPGALTSVLVDRLGAADVAALDPSEPFVASLRERLPEIDVRLGSAEDLPFDDDTFDLALAQLVVHFMRDPAAGLREMARVTRPGGLLAATVWDHAGGRGPLTPFWSGVADVHPRAPNESGLAGAREGDLVERFSAGGLADVEAFTLTVRVDFASFEDWWEPFTFGVGPAGAYVASLDDVRRAEVRDACARRLPSGPFTLDASAWGARGIIAA
ncbi:MAG: methyltransferase domain-containing protein [Nocardioidaceae bacterium]